MRLLRRIRRVLFFFFGPALLAGVIAWLWVRRDRPPLDALREARTRLNFVRQVAHEPEAERFFEEAEETLDRAQASLDAEYRRVAFFRDYDLVRSQIGRGRALCGQGLTAGEEARRAGREVCAGRIDDLRRSLSTTRTLLERLTLRDGALTLLTKAEAHISVAESRLGAQDISEVQDLLDEAAAEIAEASRLIEGRLDDFLVRRRQWDAWIRETLAWSRGQDRPAILVDKLNHECYVLRRGQVIDSYPVEMGGAWMERKLREGDRATPEGRYAVSSVKGQGESHFYKAALLDYPNDSDRRRFVRAKRKGLIPRSARIGGLIEIHGEGGRGSDWTAGCISLTNPDLDRLLAHVRVGTPVTIVGSWQEPTWVRGNAQGAREGSRSD